MTTPSLVPCASCKRHVRADEAACPFCAAPHTPTNARRIPDRGTAMRLSRAALFALGAASSGGAGCLIQGQPVYGASVPDDGSFYRPEDEGDGGATPPLVDAAYGGPPIDAGKDAAPDDAGDAGSDANIDGGDGGDGG